ELREEFLLDDEQIKILVSLPPEEQDEFLADRIFRVKIMKALIEAGVPEEKAKEALTDPDLYETVIEDEYGNQRVYKPFH
ncbi:MAG: hypothetical protein N2257_10805, partial [Thermodesulfovibrionales bacterium]|nr:hypothetical protein [Thermodesulfovibrionales bacterium]